MSPIISMDHYNNISMKACFRQKFQFQLPHDNRRGIGHRPYSLCRLFPLYVLLQSSFTTEGKFEYNHFNLSVRGCRSSLNYDHMYGEWFLDESIKASALKRITKGPEPEAESNNQNVCDIIYGRPAKSIFFPTESLGEDKNINFKCLIISQIF